MASNSQPKYLYHYTSLENLQKILKTKVIHLCPSNLLKPVKPHFENGSFVDETDSYKPVVWFTSTLISGTQSYKIAKENGLTFQKTEVCLAVPTTMFGFSYSKWDEWAIANGIDKKWFKTLKDTAPGWKNFYISEREVPLTDAIKINVNQATMDKIQSTL